MKNTYLLKYVFLLLFIFSASALFAQTSVITGKVLDETNQPLPGATVTVKGTQNGSGTDANGNFRIAGVSGTVTLQITFVGYVPAEKVVSASGNVTVNISLQPLSKNLNEVVVVGYGTQKRKDVVGAITTVSAKDFQRGEITSPEQLISGKIAGVTITSNGGSPGSGSVIRIRQGASLTASNDPLIIIDGIPLSSNGISGTASPLNLINPDDIETFTVLKDAASTAIYGSRASNGIIIITTKKGTSGKPQINASANFSIGTNPKYVSVLTADQIRAYVKNYDATNGTNVSSYLGKANTNWQDEIYQKAYTKDYNLSIAGAANKMPYRFSVGYMDANGIVKTDELQRTTIGVSLSPRLLHDDLKIDVNLKGSASQTRFANTAAIGNAIQYDPTQSVKLAGSPWDGYYEWFNTPGNPASGINPNTPHNPLGDLLDNHNMSSVYRSFGNVQFDYRLPFLHDLHFNYNFGYDISKGQGHTYVPANAAQDYNVTGGGANNPYLQKNNNIVSEFYISYNKELKSLKSNINAVAGTGYYNNQTDGYSFYQYNAAKDTISGSKPTFPKSVSEATLESYYGRLDYTFNEKYILQGSIRTDGSSKFSKANRWSIFPGAAFTWRIKDEDFLKTSSTLSDLKLRLSFGVTGNQEGIGYYGYIPTYSLGQSNSEYEFGNNFYNSYTPAPYNADVKWEQTASSNIGIDYGFFNGRLTGSIDAYYKSTTNLLEYVPIPVGSNFSNYLTINVGDMTSKGVEFSVTGVPVKTKDITWSVSFNATYQTSKITKLLQNSTPGFVGDATGGISGGTGNNIQIQSVGYTPFSFYVYKQVYGTNGKPLEGVYADLNKDGVINQADLYHDHSALPPYIYGFSTQFSYKKWTLSTVLRANVGNYMYNNVASNYGVQKNIVSPVVNVNNASTDIYNTGFVNNQYLSDYYIQNASFLKMDNLGLSYFAGNVFTKHLTLTVNANCQNVFTITKYKGIDPEIYSGIDNAFYPKPRTYTLGVNLGIK
jgi:TonB-linked SusC/RagA family outer membrane protein